MLLFVSAHSCVVLSLGMLRPPAKRRRSAVQLWITLYPRQYCGRNHGVDGHLDRALTREVLPVVDVRVRGRHEELVIEREDRLGKWRVGERPGSVVVGVLRQCCEHLTSHSLELRGGESAQVIR